MTRAQAAGLTCRPVAETVGETWRWLREVGAFRRAPGDRSAARSGWTRPWRPPCSPPDRAPAGQADTTGRSSTSSTLTSRGRPARLAVPDPQSHLRCAEPAQGQPQLFPRRGHLDRLGEHRRR